MNGDGQEVVIMVTPDDPSMMREPELPERTVLAYFALKMDCEALIELAC